MRVRFQDSEDLQLALNDVIYSSRAISDVAHLKGRDVEINELTKALLTPGRQPFIYGLRGAGKTSLALSVSGKYSKTSNVLIGCAPQMGFGDIIRDLVASALDRDLLESERSIAAQREGSLDAGILTVGGANLETKSYRGIPSPQNPNEALALLKQVAAKNRKDFAL